MWKKIKDYIKKWNMLEENDKVIAGISGGPDSVCLFYVLMELKKQMNIDVVSVHVNHQLRGKEADHDEEYVKQLCREYDVPCEIYSVDVESVAKKKKQSVEEAARDVRRECFDSALKKYNATKIALAHHQNDNVETFFLNISRGSGLKGLTGIHPVNGKTIRPLLCVTRQEIEDFLEERKISYCNDYTNSTDDYTRNRIRNHIIPVLENGVNHQAVNHISQTMENIWKIYEYIEGEADKHYDDIVKEEKGNIQIVKKKLECMPEVLQEIILKKALVQCTKAQKDIQAVHIYDLKELLDKQTGKKLDLPYNVQAVKNYEGICMGKYNEEKKEKINISKKIDFTKNKEIKSGNIKLSCREVKEYKKEKLYTKYFDYDIIKSTLEVRTRMPGDYLIIDKEGKKQKLKSYFINEKIPQNQRDHILLLTQGHHVLWVIGYRRDCTYLIEDDTKQILEITIDKGE